MMSTVTAVILFLLTSYVLLNYQAQGQPEFNSNDYSTSIYENVTIGTPLNLSISAVGPDNTPVTYSSFITTFSINRTTGVIYTAASIDYETQQLYKFAVGATDEINRTVTANVTVTVLDVNDNPPVFSPSQYNTTISEDSKPSTTVVVLKATDADRGTNAQISYSITGGNEEKRFRINSTSGSLLTANTLDRETTASYNLTVQATNGGNPALSSTATVSVGITDVNDNSPVFAYTTTLPFDKREEWSYTITATDRDSGANAAITYSITDGDVAEIFTINQRSGEIRVTQTFDPGMFPTFTLTVQATDGGTPTTKNDQATVMITVDTDPTSPCGSTAALHSVKMLQYSLLPSLVLLVSAALRM